MKKRLIDANALKESFRKQTVNVQGKIKDDADAIIEAICKDVDLAPTVDAVPVVRCGECKHRDYCDIYAHVKAADFFCKAGWMDLYRGERKDGEHDV